MFVLEKLISFGYGEQANIIETYNECIRFSDGDRRDYTISGLVWGGWLWSVIEFHAL